MMNLVSEKRGVVEHTESLDGTRVMLQGTVPMNEILVDFPMHQKSYPRLWEHGLRSGRLPAIQDGEARHARERRPG